MKKIKNLFLRFKRSVGNKIENFRNQAQNVVKEFKENYSEAKSKPVSKRKSLLLGFSTILGVFRVTLFAPGLLAVAKDLPQDAPKTDICPSPSKQPVLAPSKEVIKVLSGAAASLCGLAVSTGSFWIGAACGLVVAIGILKAQGR